MEGILLHDGIGSIDGASLAVGSSTALPVRMNIAGVDLRFEIVIKDLTSGPSLFILADRLTTGISET